MKNIKAEKPKKIETKADVEAACVWAEEVQEALADHIKVFPETFNPIRRVSMILRSGQITQDDDGNCDGPLLQKLEARTTDHINAQKLDYAPVLHVAAVAAKVANELLGEVNADTDTDPNNRSPKPDMGNADQLSDSDRKLIEGHDAAVLQARQAEQVEKRNQQRKELKALSDRAKHVEGVLKENCTAHALHVQKHFREQALNALEWAHSKAGLKPPYVLPGTLETLPNLFNGEGEETDNAA